MTKTYMKNNSEENMKNKAANALSLYFEDSANNRNAGYDIIRYYKKGLYKLVDGHSLLSTEDFFEVVSGGKNPLYNVLEAAKKGYLEVA